MQFRIGQGLDIHAFTDGDHVMLCGVRLPHDRGLAVKVWTVNDVDRMNQLIDLGVDGIITDYPDRLRAVMAARGLSLPSPTPPE